MKNPFDPGFYNSEELRGFGFARVGENVQVSKDCTIIGLENIELGDHSRIDSGVHIIATSGKLILHGRNHIGGGSHLCVGADLTFGRFSGCSQGVRIYTASDDYTGRWMTGPCAPSSLRGGRCEPIVIGRHCVIGSGSVILPGCDLGDGVSVGALSLVTKPLESWGIYHGNPARRIKARSKRVLELEALIAERLVA